MGGLVLLVFGPTLFILGAIAVHMGAFGRSGDLIDLLVAIGTLGAVAVALWESLSQRADAASRVYFEEARRSLEIAIDTFLSKTDDAGRPLNDRLHWLNFARGLNTALALGRKIRSRELSEIWSETAHQYRSKLYDVLKPVGDSIPAGYYGYIDNELMHKNIVQNLDDWMPLSEASLVTVYRWLKWPKERADPIDRDLEFAPEEIERMTLFGPKGLGEYLTKMRAFSAEQAKAK